MSLCHGRHSVVQQFGPFLAPFLECSGLPFAKVLSERQIEEAFAAEGALFGQGDDDVYTPGITLWAFLSQVMHGGQLRSCKAAADRVSLLRLQLDLKRCSVTSGAYCRARAKLPESVLERLTNTVADELERRVPRDWLWCGRHVKIVDGTTATMADTADNQKVYPQQSSQKAGLGFPIARMVGILSLATGALCGLSVGPYSGKETGEPALLRQMWDRFDEGDVVLSDSAYGSYFMLALGQQRGLDWVVRLHQRRKADFRRGERLGRGDHIVVWHRPEQPEWMDDQTYASIPETLRLREVQILVDQPGFRTEHIVVVTTLLDANRYPKQAIADAFRARWHAELDLRSIKEALEMAPLRCKSPQMVHRELWTHWLAYNLIRKVMAQAAIAGEVGPREISFTGARVSITNAWDLMTINPKAAASLGRHRLREIASQRVGNRPNRVEPRAVKRRPKPHKLLHKPRDQARAELVT